MRSRAAGAPTGRPRAAPTPHVMAPSRRRLMNDPRRQAGPLLALTAVLLLAACSAYRPQPPAQPAFLSRTQTETRAAVRASVAALGAKESAEYFGVNLAAHGIQPVWVEIENGGAVPLYLLLSSVDPAYFSAREAAYRMHSWLGTSNNQRIDEYFDSQAIDGRIPAGATRAGFVFTNLDERIKYVTVQLFGPRETMAFYFLVDVPGVRTDYDLVDFDGLYHADEIVDLEGEDELRAALERLPPYTTRKDGTGQGDGLNFVLIATPDEVGGTLVASGWQVTEALGAGSGWRTFKAFLFGGRYRYSPMSSLYVFGRSQDAGFQKARDSIRRRNHLRLWLTPLRFQGREVWVGAISRDIGVYFTPRAWSLTTHAIDPDLDEAREALAEDLVLSQAVRKFGYVGGVGAAPPAAPHRNLMRAPYWSDGQRAVFVFGDEPTSLTDLDLFEWEIADDPSGQRTEPARAKTWPRTPSTAPAAIGNHGDR